MQLELQAGVRGKLSAERRPAISVGDKPQPFLRIGSFSQWPRIGHEICEITVREGQNEGIK